MTHAVGLIVGSGFEMLGLDVVAIVCSFDGSVLWQIDLRDTQSAALPIATDLPVPPTVRSRGAAERTEQESEGS